MAKTKKKKLYVVGRGRQPGIYLTWDEAKAQVDGFPGARYKSFSNLAEAKEAYAAWTGQKVEEIDWSAILPASANQFGRRGRLIDDAGPRLPSITVDAASSGNPGVMEYRGVLTEDGKMIFHRGPFEDGTNNVGEYLAIVHALTYCREHGIGWPIYSDSRTALSWVKKRRANTTLSPTGRNGRLFVLIEQANAWLEENTYANALLKWDTEAWGENPADFGRK